jgi:hypothetical protein
MGSVNVLGQHPRIQKQYLARWDVRPPDTGWSTFRMAAWHLGLLTSALQEISRSHADWPVVIHERFCDSPVERFRELAEGLGLDWTVEAETFLRDSNRPGTGFHVQRITSELPNRWRDRLSPAETREAQQALSEFPIRIESGWDWPG